VRERVDPGNLDAAAGREAFAGEQAEECGFAGTVGADEEGAGARG